MDEGEVSPKGNGRPVMLVFGGVLLVLGVVACGRSPNKTESQTPAGGSDPEQGLQAFAQCMRDNGVANYPEPVGDSINLRGTGIDRNTPAFKAAEAACIALLPRPPDRAAGGPGRGEREADGSGTGGDAPGGGNAISRGDPAAWEKIVPGGDCACADGSAFAFWDRKGDPAKVVFYLEGSGSCFNAETCAFTGTGGENDFYDYNVSGETPGLGGGVFAFDRADNPFADYTYIYVPLCTGDVYLGNAIHEYTPELTVHHKGFADGTAALHYLAEHYPGAAQVVVLGKTAGSVAAPIYGALAADLLPEARVTVLGAQSGAFPEDPDFTADVLDATWGAFGTMPDWEVNQGLTARDWGLRRFWIQAGLHNPGIVMARFDYAFDRNAARTLQSRGVDPSTMVALIDANEAATEAAGVVLHSYTAPGDHHGIYEYDRFYEIEVDGVRLVDWIKALIDGKPLADVHCDPCEG
jgi:hypothetical protein